VGGQILVEVDESANGHELDLPVDGELQISLRENAATGFAWAVEHSGAPICELLADHFENISTGIGSGGVHHWRFRAKQKGTGKIVLHYSRSWEDKPPEKSFGITVRVN
jgi:predicted secreted protein